jgi:hypothetical protein
MCIAGGAVCESGAVCANSTCPPPPAQCGGGNHFMTFARDCMLPTDCGYGLHQIDCCGSRMAVSFSIAEQQNFNTAEAAWDASCAACGCAPHQLVDSMGNVCASGMAMQVCNNRRCDTQCK